MLSLNVESNLPFKFNQMKKDIYLFISGLSFIRLAKEGDELLPATETGRQGEISRYIMTTEELSINLDILHHFNLVTHYAESYLNNTPKSHNPIDILFHINRGNASLDDACRFMCDYLSAFYGYTQLEPETVLYIAITKN